MNMSVSALKATIECRAAGLTPSRRTSNQRPARVTGRGFALPRRVYDRAMAYDLRPKVFRDRIIRDNWRVEKTDRDGGYNCIEYW